MSEINKTNPIKLKKTTKLKERFKEEENNGFSDVMKNSADLDEASTKLTGQPAKVEVDDLVFNTVEDYFRKNNKVDTSRGTVTIAFPKSLKNAVAKVADIGEDVPTVRLLSNIVYDWLSSHEEEIQKMRRKKMNDELKNGLLG